MPSKRELLHAVKHRSVQAPSVMSDVLTPIAVKTTVLGGVVPFIRVDILMCVSWELLFLSSYVLSPSSLLLSLGGSRFLQNVRTHAHECMTSHYRTLVAPGVFVSNRLP